jgi:hypothetical protein
MLPAGVTVAAALLCALTPAYFPAAHQDYMLAQIETETCVSMHSPTCFTPRAELKTAREYGFGYGQITVTRSMNNFSMLRRSVPALHNWSWADRFNGKNQVIGLLFMDSSAYNSCKPLMSSSYDAMACAYSAYNGGFGGFRADRRLCSNTKGCDPTKWFGNVERTSLKAKTASHGYGKSFFQINRDYVHGIMTVRNHKYEGYVCPTTKATGSPRTS